MGRPSLSNVATPIRAIKRGEYMECMIVPVSLKMHTPSEAGRGWRKESTPWLFHSWLFLLEFIILPGRDDPQCVSVPGYMLSRPVSEWRCAAHGSVLGDIKRGDAVWVQLQPSSWLLLTLVLVTESHTTGRQTDQPLPLHSTQPPSHHSPNCSTLRLGCIIGFIR